MSQRQGLVEQISIQLHVAQSLLNLVETQYMPEREEQSYKLAGANERLKRSLANTLEAAQALVEVPDNAWEATNVI